MATEINLDRCGPFQLPHINHRKNVNVCITLPGKGVRLFWQVFTQQSLVQLKKKPQFWKNCKKNSNIIIQFTYSFQVFRDQKHKTQG